MSVFKCEDNMDPLPKNIPSTEDKYERTKRGEHLLPSLN